MEATGNQAKLVFLRGKRSGDEIELGGTQYRLGSASSCELVVDGSTVEAVHALLEPVGEDWYITDRSQVGLLVNGEKTARTQLFGGDRIQIGNDHLLELRITAGQPEKKKRKKGDKGGGGMLRSPWFYLVLGLFYIGFFTGVYFIVTGSDKDDSARLTAARMQQLLCRSDRYLQRLGPDDGNRAGAVGQDRQDCVALPEDAGTGESADHDAVVISCERQRAALAALQQDDLAQAEADALRAALLSGLHQQLLDAWLFESQGRLREALGAYDTLVDCLPDVRLPATRFALERRRLIRDQR